MSASRVGCCDKWPKPCPYHEGYEDGAEEVERLRLTPLVLAKERFQAENAALRAMLAKLEWSGADSGSDLCCPNCGGGQTANEAERFCTHEGHMPGCELAALLGERV